jgi:hypothetical protein
MLVICDLYRGRKPPIINHFYQYATSAEVVQYRLDSYKNCRVERAFIKNCRVERYR